MISLSVLFWMYVVLFAIIGGMRGWAKEILVTSGVIVALFLITIMESFIPFIRDSLTPQNAFWVRISVLVVMTFFGYQGPNIPHMTESGKFIRDRFEDLLLRIFLGSLNGYMIFGSAWHYLMEAGYPFDWIQAPDQITQAGRNVEALINILPPQWLTAPTVYIAVAIAFVFILVVFI